MLFRVHTNLGFTSGIRYVPGDIEPLKEVSGTIRQILLARGAISKVQAPPLHILPGWRDRAELFESVGITDVDQLICADLREVSEKTQVPLSTLVLYVSVVKQFLVL